MYLEFKETWYYKSHIFEQQVPTKDAKDWFCKYHLIGQRSLVSISQAGIMRPYIYVETENYGFD
jgi:hypothetical protein